VRSRIARIVALALLATTLAGACSGDGVSKEEFVEAADAVCREADEAIRAIGAPRVEEGVRDYVEDATRIGEDLVSELRELEKPQGAGDAVQPMIEGIEKAIALLEPLAEAIIERDSEAVADLQQQAEQVTDEISGAAESYGFETCGGKVLQPTS
jgi:hypothetical protein